MKNKIIIALSVIALIAAGGSYVQLIEWGFVKEPFKVTDPHDPRFDPERFRFTDYDSKEEWVEVLKVMFPLGTPKERIDAILVKHAGAKAFESTSELKHPSYKAISYIDYKGRAYFKGAPNTLWIFKNDILANFMVSRLYAYEGQPTIYDIRIQNDR